MISARKYIIYLWQRMEAQKDKTGSVKAINQANGLNQMDAMKVPSKKKIQPQKSPKK